MLFIQRETNIICYCIQCDHDKDACHDNFMNGNSKFNLKYLHKRYLFENRQRLFVIIYSVSKIRMNIMGVS